MEVSIVPIDDIEIGERFRVDLGNIDELKSSIKANGLIQPPAVLRKKDGKYRLLAGGRRMQALAELKKKEIPVRIYDTLTDIEARTIELAENLHRKEMTWSEEVLLKKEIHELQVQKHGEKISRSPDADGWSKTDTSKLIGESKQNTASDISLAEMLSILPGLALCKNKSEAHRYLHKMKKEYADEDIRKKLETQKSTIPLDVRRKVVADSYIICDFLKAEIDGLFDFIEIDPPYGVDLKKAKNKTVSAKNYNEIPDEEYYDFLEKVLTKAASLLTETGWLILWNPLDRMHRCISILDELDLKVAKSGAYWIKEAGTTQSTKYLLGTACECFIYARKGNATLGRPGRTNVFQYKRVPATIKEHPAERPIDLIDDIIRTFGVAGKRTLVPFAGSGVTLMAAVNYGSEVLGFDLSEEYRNTFVRRVYESSPGQYTNQPRKDKKNVHTDSK